MPQGQKEGFQSNATHKIKQETGIFLKPAPGGDLLFTAQAGTLIVVIDEFMGPSAKWHMITIADPENQYSFGNFGKFLYIDSFQVTKMPHIGHSLPRIYTCKRNNFAVTPDWRIREEYEPFLDKETCEYQSIAIPRDEQGMSYKTTTILADEVKGPEVLREARRRGVVNLLEYYDKQRSASYVEHLLDAFRFSHIPDSFGENPAEGYYIDDRPYAPLKFLVRVPAKYFDAVPRNLESFEDMMYREGWYDRGWNEVNFITETFEEKINRVADRLEEYAQNIADSGGDVVGLNLNQEAERIRLLFSEVRALVEENGITWTPDCGKIIEFGIASDYRGLAYVSYSDDLEDSTLLKVGFSRFKRTEPMNCPRTLAYLNRLDDMDTYFQNNSMGPWSEFVSGYVFPPVAVHPEAAGSPLPETRVTAPSEGSNLKRDVCGVMKTIEHAVDTISEHKKDFDAKTREKQGLPPLDKETKDKEDSFFDNPQVQELMASCSRDAFSEIGDVVTQNIPKLLKGKMNIEQFYHSVINKVGIFDLINFILSCITANMTLMDFLEAFCKSVLDFLPTDDLMKMYDCLDPWVKAEVAAFSKALDGNNFEKEWANFAQKTVQGFRNSVAFEATKQEQREAMNSLYSKPTLLGGSPSQELARNLLNNNIDAQACAIADKYNKPKTPITLSYPLDPNDPDNPDKLGTHDSNDANLRSVLNSLVPGPMIWDCMQKSLTDEKLENACWQLIDHLSDLYKTGQKVADFVMHLPPMPDDFPIADLLKFIMKQIKEMIIALVAEVIITIVKELLRAIKEACLPQPLTEEFYGGADLRQFLPPNAPEQVFGDFNFPAGMFDPLNNLLDDLSSMLLPSELCSLLSGDATPDTTKVVRGLIAERYPNLELECGVSIEDLMSRLGAYAPVEMCNDIDDNKHRSPASPLGLLCERDNQKINFRRKLLSGKMSSDEIDNQLEQNKRDRQKKLRKYIDMMRRGNPLEEMLPDIMSTCGMNAAGGAGQGLVPRDIPSLSFMTDKLSNAMFSLVESTFNKDISTYPDTIIVRTPMMPDVTMVSGDTGNVLVDGAVSQLQSISDKYDSAEDMKKLEMLTGYMASNGGFMMIDKVAPGLKFLMGSPERIRKVDGNGAIDVNYNDDHAAYAFVVPYTKGMKLAKPALLTQLQKWTQETMGEITERQMDLQDLESVPIDARSDDQKEKIKDLKEKIGDLRGDDDSGLKYLVKKLNKATEKYNKDKALAIYEETGDPLTVINFQILSKTQAISLGQASTPYSKYFMRVLDVDQQTVLEYTWDEGEFINASATKGFTYLEDGSTYQASTFANILAQSFELGPPGSGSPNVFGLKEITELPGFSEAAAGTILEDAGIWDTPLIDFFKRDLFHGTYLTKLRSTLLYTLKSPLFRADVLTKVRFTPPVDANTCSKDNEGKQVKSILDMETAKTQAKDQYDESCHSMLDAEQAYKDANATACIYLLIKVFAIEEFMKSMFTLTQFRASNDMAAGSVFPGLLSDPGVAEYLSLVISKKISMEGFATSSTFKSSLRKTIDARKAAEPVLRDPFTGDIVYKKGSVGSGGVESTADIETQTSSDINNISDYESQLKFLIKEQISTIGSSIDKVFDEALGTVGLNLYQQFIDFVVDVPKNAYSKRLWESVTLNAAQDNENANKNIDFRPIFPSLNFEGKFIIERFFRIRDKEVYELDSVIEESKQAAVGIFESDAFAAAVKDRVGGPGNRLPGINNDGLGIEEGPWELENLRYENGEFESDSQWTTPIHLGGVVNVAAFEEWLDANSWLMGGQDAQIPLKRYFNSVEYGIRLCYLPPLSLYEGLYNEGAITGFTKGSSKPSTTLMTEIMDLFTSEGCPFKIDPNVNLYTIPNPDIVAFEKAYALFEAPEMQALDPSWMGQKAPNPDATSEYAKTSYLRQPWVHTIPLVEVAQPLSFNGNSHENMTMRDLQDAVKEIYLNEVVDDADVANHLSNEYLQNHGFEELMDGLLNSPTFRLLVEDIFSVKKFPSLVMIFNSVLMKIIFPDSENTFRSTRASIKMLLYTLATEKDREKYYDYDASPAVTGNTGAMERSEYDNEVDSTRCFKGPSPDFDFGGLMNLSFDLDLKQMFKSLAINIDPNFSALFDMFKAGEICEITWATLFEKWPINFPFGWGPPLTPFGMIGLSLGLLPCESNACKQEKCDDGLPPLPTGDDLFDEITTDMTSAEKDGLIYIPQEWSELIEATIAAWSKIEQDIMDKGQGWTMSAHRFKNEGPTGTPLGYYPLETWPGDSPKHTAGVDGTQIFQPDAEPKDLPEMRYANAKLQMIAALRSASEENGVIWMLTYEEIFGVPKPDNIPWPEIGEPVNGSWAAYLFCKYIPSERETTLHILTGGSGGNTLGISGAGLVPDNQEGAVLEELPFGNLFDFGITTVNYVHSSDVADEVTSNSYFIRSEPSWQDRIAMEFCDSWCYNSHLQMPSYPDTGTMEELTNARETFCTSRFYFAYGLVGIDRSPNPQGEFSKFGGPMVDGKENLVYDDSTPPKAIAMAGRPWSFITKPGVDPLTGMDMSANYWKTDTEHPMVRYTVADFGSDQPAPGKMEAFMTFANKCRAFGGSRMNQQFWVPVDAYKHLKGFFHVSDITKAGHTMLWDGVEAMISKNNMGDKGHSTPPDMFSALKGQSQYSSGQAAYDAFMVHLLGENGQSPLYGASPGMYDYSNGQVHGPPLLIPLVELMKLFDNQYMFVDFMQDDGSKMYAVGIKMRVKAENQPGAKWATDPSNGYGSWKSHPTENGVPVDTYLYPVDDGPIGCFEYYTPAQFQARYDKNDDWPPSSKISYHSVHNPLGSYANIHPMDIRHRAGWLVPLQGDGECSPKTRVRRRWEMQTVATEGYNAAAIANINYWQAQKEEGAFLTGSSEQWASKNPLSTFPVKVRLPTSTWDCEQQIIYWKDGQNGQSTKRAGQILDGIQLADYDIPGLGNKGSKHDWWDSGEGWNDGYGLEKKTSKWTVIDSLTLSAWGTQPGTPAAIPANPWYGLSTGRGLMAPLDVLYNQILEFQKSPDPFVARVYDFTWNSKLLCEEGAWWAGGPPENIYGVHPTGLYDPATRTIDTSVGQYSNWAGFANIGFAGTNASNSWYEGASAAGGEDVQRSFPTMEDITWDFAEQVDAKLVDNTLVSLTVGGVEMMKDGNYITFGQSWSDWEKEEREALGMVYSNNSSQYYKKDHNTV